MLAPAADLPRADEFEGGAHLPIRAAPRELGGQGPQVDPVLVAEGVAPDAVLLVMVKTAEADAEDIVRPLALAGVGGRFDQPVQSGVLNCVKTSTYKQETPCAHCSSASLARSQTYA